MPYRLAPDRPVADEIARVIGEQIDKALVELNDADLPRAEVVHQVRKRCKKIRAALRLVRAELDSDARHDHLFRDLARRLSTARDMDAILETFDHLVNCGPSSSDAKAIKAVRRELTSHRGSGNDKPVDVDQRLAEARTILAEARQRYQSLSFDAEGFDALGKGMGKTYKRARKAKEEAYAQPDAPTFHEWRKRVKDHWYHTRLLQNARPRMMKARRKVLRKLANTLGEEHDLAVISDRLNENPSRFGGKHHVEVVLRRIDQCREKLRAKARPLGEKVFSEKPSRLVRRVGRDWPTEDQR